MSEVPLSIPDHAPEHNKTWHEEKRKKTPLLLLTKKLSRVVTHSDASFESIFYLPPHTKGVISVEDSVSVYTKFHSQQTFTMISKI